MNIKSFATLMMLGASIVSYSKEKIVVYTPSSMDWLQETIAEDFKTKTGVEVEFIGIDGMVGRMKLEKRRPKADVVLGLTEANVVAAKRDNLLIKYKPENADLIIRDEFVLDKDWFATSFDYGSLAINTNTAGINPMPTSFEDLKGLDKQLIALDPNSSTGQEFMLWTLALYKDNWKEFWNELKPALLTVTPGWSEGWAKFTANEAPLMVGYASSDVYFEEGSTYKSFIPKEGGYIYLEGAGIVNKKDVKEGAKEFMEYILEEKFQTAMYEKNYMLPITDIDLGESYKRIPTSSKIVKARVQDVERVEELKKELTELLRK